MCPEVIKTPHPGNGTVSSQVFVAVCFLRATTFYSETTPEDLSLHIFDRSQGYLELITGEKNKKREKNRNG